MKALMNTLMTCAILGMMSTSAFAGGSGGGGAKDDGTIVVKNDAGADQILLVVVGNLNSVSLTGFLAAGGQIVSPGETASFDVSAGDHVVNAIIIHDGLLVVTGAANSETFNVGAKTTVNVKATISAGVATLQL